RQVSIRWIFHAHLVKADFPLLADSLIIGKNNINQIHSLDTFVCPSENTARHQRFKYLHLVISLLRTHLQFLSTDNSINAYNDKRNYVDNFHHANLSFLSSSSRSCCLSVFAFCTSSHFLFGCFSARACFSSLAISFCSFARLSSRTICSFSVWPLSTSMCPI